MELCWLCMADILEESAVDIDQSRQQRCAGGASIKTSAISTTCIERSILSGDTTPNFHSAVKKDVPKFDYVSEEH